VETVVLVLNWCVDLAQKDAWAAANVTTHSFSRRHLTHVQPGGLAAHFTWEEVALQPPRLTLLHKAKVDRTAIALHVQLVHACNVSTSSVQWRWRIFIFSKNKRTCDRADFFVAFLLEDRCKL